MIWTCRVCGERRFDEDTAVISADISTKFGLPEGSAKANVVHCNDKVSCREGAMKILEEESL